VNSEKWEETRKKTSLKCNIRAILDIKTLLIKKKKGVGGKGGRKEEIRGRVSELGEFLVRVFDIAEREEDCQWELVEREVKGGGKGRGNERGGERGKRERTPKKAPTIASSRGNPRKEIKQKTRLRGGGGPDLAKRTRFLNEGTKGTLN